jgi:hypothetical protein
MSDPQVRERRGNDRIPLEGKVVVKIHECEMLGPSRNISQDGIYFITPAEMAVEIQLPDGLPTLHGKIVRVGAVRDGELGVAIRFDKPLPSELLPQQD